MKKILLLSTFLFCLTLHAQVISPVNVSELQTKNEKTSADAYEFEDVNVKKLRPLRLGVKLGLPNIGTVNLEYLTPLFDNRVAVYGDYMQFEKGFTEGLLDFKSFEVGANIYFNNKGKGFYGGLGYTNLHAGFGYENYFDDETMGEFKDGYANVKMTTFNVKLGFKVGRTVYFRTEIGYAFGSLPKTVEINSVDYVISEYGELPEIPLVFDSGVLLFNIGFGVGFL